MSALSSLFGGLPPHRKPPRPPSWASALLLIFQGLACTGSVGNGAQTSNDMPGMASGGGRGGVGSMDPAGTAGHPAFECDTAKAASGPPRVWRLNSVQYANTVGAFVAGSFPSSPTQHKSAAIEAPFAEVDRAHMFSTHASAYGIVDNDLTQVLDASRAAAALVVKQLEEQKALCASDGYAACIKSLVQTRGPILFHRPLQPDEVDHYTALATTNRQQLGDVRALTLALRAMLAAPQFLFRSELGEAQGDDKRALTAFELATALAYSLTDGPPDQEIWDAANSGQLSDQAELHKHVEKLLGNLQTDKLSQFFFEWFGYEGVLQVAKDEKSYPKHNGELLLDDARRFVTEVLSSQAEGGFLTALLTSPQAVVRGQTAWSYGVESDIAADAAPKMTNLPANQRSGLLTHPALLVAGSHPEATDPVRRGLFVRERLLCDVVPRAEIGSIPPLPDLGPNATVRDRLKIHIEGSGCKGCHMLMDPIGLGMENYDHLGRHRTTEAGKPVDNSGQLDGAGENVDGAFHGALELGEKLAKSARVQACLGQQAFRFFLGRTETEQDGCTLANAHKAFGDSQNFKALLLTLFTSDAFRFRRPTP